MLSASYLTFRRANLSLMGCTSAEPISVSVRSKVQRIKLYLQTVEIPNHFQIQFSTISIGLPDILKQVSTRKYIGNLLINSLLLYLNKAVNFQYRSNTKLLF
jgi:hypothetical protein